MIIYLSLIYVLFFICKADFSLENYLDLMTSVEVFQNVEVTNFNIIVVQKHNYPMKLYDETKPTLYFKLIQSSTTTFFFHF